jgi:peroxiredoxin
MLRNGTIAPDFTLRDQDGTEQSLGALRDGKVLVINFFRGTFCPTARRDLINLNDAGRRTESLGAKIVGISADAPEQLRYLRRHLDLQFTLLSDVDYEVSPQYGVYESEDGEGPPRHAEPALVVIDANGNTAWSQIQSGPKGLTGAGELFQILLVMHANGGVY